MNGLRFAVVLVVGVAVGLVAGRGVSDAAGERNAYDSLRLFSRVLEQVRDHYVEEVDEDQLIEAAIQGMLKSLDPHSVYLPPRAYDDMQTDTRGEFGGLGIEVTMENSLVKVVSPIEGSPADEAGLAAGDYITHLDGEAVQGLTLAEAVDKMRGPIGEDITLTILRAGVDPFDVTITRDRITIRSVWGRLEKGDVGYVRVSQFNEKTQAGLEAAIKKMRSEAGANFSGLVLDLRNNPGGLLSVAISVSDSFLEQGVIVSTRGRNGADIQDAWAEKGDIVDGAPMVVLINGGSASASEIVAGALQDHGRALVVGTDSFGKGSVQSLLPLQGSNAALKLTTQRYYTPSGESIQARGIKPDIVVEQALLQKVGNDFRHEADLRNALQNEKDEAAQQEDGGENPQQGAGEAAPQDYQLSRALDLIHAIGLYRRNSQSG